MTETCETFTPTTFGGLTSVISLQALADGPSPCEPQDGPTTAKSGRGLALANLSARQAEVLGLLTSGTSGRTGTTSSASADLQSFLASRLRVKTACLGSTLYTLTWKDRATPSGLLISALRALAPRTSGSGSGSSEQGWATPTTHDSKGTDYNRYSAEGKGENRSHALQDQAQLAGWPTAATRDGKGGYLGGRMRDGKISTDTLDVAAQLCGPARRTATGEMLTGSSAGTASGGQLNPDHSRWLMGYPAAWASCAPTATPSSRKSRQK